MSVSIMWRPIPEGATLATGNTKKELLEKVYKQSFPMKLTKAEDLHTTEIALMASNEEVFRCLEQLLHNKDEIILELEY